MATVGDVNGDGYEDFMVTVPNEVLPTVGATGTAYLYYGPLCALDNDPAVNSLFQQITAGPLVSNINIQNYVLDGSQPTGSAGISPASLPEVNGAGKVGLSGCLRSSTLGMKPLPLKFTVLGADATVNLDRYGYGLNNTRAKKGDFNGDGYDDVLLGSYTSNNPATGLTNSGNGVVFFGSKDKLNISDYPTNTLALGASGAYRPFIVVPRNADSGSKYFRGNVSSGDVNNDGTADYLVTSTFYNGSGATRGIWIGTFFVFY
jgi:hypothetical protein